MRNGFDDNRRRRQSDSISYDGVGEGDKMQPLTIKKMFFLILSHAADGLESTRKFIDYSHFILLNSSSCVYSLHNNAQNGVILNLKTKNTPRRDSLSFRAACTNIREGSRRRRSAKLFVYCIEVELNLKIVPLIYNDYDNLIRSFMLIRLWIVHLFVQN